MTVADLISDSLVMIQELTRGQTPSPEDYGYGLSELNALLDLLSTERLHTFAVTKVQFQLVADQQDYTIGPTGADFTNERPVLIQTATIILDV